jgi:alpha-tubulin suppressor-like RCC1 family protein
VYLDQVRHVGLARLSLLIPPLAACASFGSDSPPSVTNVQPDAAVEGGGPIVDAIIDASIGVTSICVVRATGKLFCWGSNSNGTLGIANGDGSCGASPCRSTPTLIPDVPNAIAVSIGTAGACAIQKSGDVVCWGPGMFGITGTGATSTTTLPPAKVLGLAKKAIEIGVGENAACARVEGESATEVWCWGMNDNGIIGLPFDAAAHVPTRIPSLDGAKALRVAATHPTACAIRSDDQVVCWGENVAGILGHAPGTAPDETFNNATSSYIPTVVGQSFTADLLTLGNGFACARRIANGALACWGLNLYGALANGTSGSSAPQPTPLDLALPSKAVAIEARSGHACALMENATVRCWGWNVDGEVGNGRLGTPCPYSSVCVTAPTGVEGISDIARIATGFHTTLAIGKTGSAWAWGLNNAGQLGHAPATAPDVSLCGFSGTDPCSPNPAPLVLPL